MKNKKLVIALFTMIVMFTIFVTASYSYFVAQGTASGFDKQATVIVGELKLTYNDGSEYLSSQNGFEPGNYFIKNFSVTNDTNSTLYYRIYMDDVVNTFIMQNPDESILNRPYELIYTLKKNDVQVISESSNTPVLKKTGIIYGLEGLGIEIAPKLTDNYELMIKFIDTGLNQNYNQAKLFSAKIDLKIKSMYEIFSDMIDTREDLAYDDYDNIRFIGKDASNYISFNDEEWRVVGLFKDMEVVNDDGTTSKQDLIKIVRNGTLGDIQWDAKGQYGENDWTNADLMNRLNGDYLNNEGTYTQSSTIKSLANEVDKIAKVRWNIGGYNTTAITPQSIYTKERGNLGGGKNPSATTWDGKVALMYPSDYGYSVKGNDNTENANNCLNTNMSIWNSNGCFAQTWIHNRALQWLLTPWSGDTNLVFLVYSIGGLSNRYAGYTAISIRPALYLKADIKLTGTGEQGENIFRIVE